MADHPYRVVVVRWLPVSWALAMTIGSVIFTKRPLTEKELAHELVHVCQWATYGVGFIPRYALASWRSWRAGDGWYHGNEFEVAARKGLFSC